MKANVFYNSFIKINIFFKKNSIGISKTTLFIF